MPLILQENLNSYEYHINTTEKITPNFLKKPKRSLAVHFNSFPLQSSYLNTLDPVNFEYQAPANFAGTGIVLISEHAVVYQVAPGFRTIYQSSYRAGLSRQQPIESYFVVMPYQFFIITMINWKFDSHLLWDVKPFSIKNTLNFHYPRSTNLYPGLRICWGNVGNVSTIQRLPVFERVQALVDYFFKSSGNTDLFDTFQQRWKTKNSPFYNIHNWDKFSKQLLNDENWLEKVLDPNLYPSAKLTPRMKFLLQCAPNKTKNLNSFNQNHFTNFL